MELYIFDRDIEFKGILEGFSSLRWNRRYSKCGEFELHCGLTKQSIELLRQGNIIWKKDDLEAGYIEFRQITKDADGREFLRVKGSFLSGLIGSRIIWGIKNYDDTPENIMRSIVNENMITPTDADRVIGFFRLGTPFGGGVNTKLQVSYKNALQAIEELSIANEIGFYTGIDIEAKEAHFTVYSGKDRTFGNGVNPASIFSQEFENVFEQDYTDSFVNYANTALIAGEGEGVNRELVAVEEGSGLDRKEIFVDARDLRAVAVVNDEEIPMPINEYRDLLIARGDSVLSERVVNVTFDSKINTKSNLLYKQDFDVGDLVTVRSSKWGLTVDVRIQEIEEVYEQSTMNINVTFGDALPTLIDKIRQEVR